MQINKTRPIKSKYTEWGKSAERLLLYFDIMGFKSRMNSKSHGELLKEFINFRDKWSKGLDQFRLGDNIRYTQFSDTVLIVAKGTDEKMFNIITKAGCRFMQQALGEGFAVKGVLSQGKFYYDNEKELYFGKPLVDAYELYEEVKYYGVVVHHTAERTVKTFRSHKDPYEKTPVKLKDGEMTHYHLAWNLLDYKLSPANYTKKCLEWLDKIEETVSGSPRIYIDNTRKVLEADGKVFDEEQNTIVNKNNAPQFCQYAPKNKKQKLK